MEGRNLAKNFFTKSHDRTFDSGNHFKIESSETAHTKKSIISMISTLQNKRVAPATQNDSSYTNNHNYKPKIENSPRNNFFPRQVGNPMKKPRNEAAKKNLAKYLNVDRQRADSGKQQEPSSYTEVLNQALYNPSLSRKRESSKKIGFRNDFKSEPKKSKIDFRRQNAVIQSAAEPITEPVLPVKSEKRGKKHILKRFLEDVDNFARESSGSETGSNDLDVLSLKSDENIKFDNDDNGYVPGAGLKNNFNC